MNETLVLTKSNYMGDIKSLRLRWMHHELIPELSVRTNNWKWSLRDGNHPYSTCEFATLHACAQMAKRKGWKNWTKNSLGEWEKGSISGIQFVIVFHAEIDRNKNQEFHNSFLFIRLVRYHGSVWQHKISWSWPVELKFKLQATTSTSFAADVRL